MTKKNGPTDGNPNPPQGDENQGAGCPAETPEAAASAVALAEAELKRAREAYDRVYDEAIRRLRDVREAKVGDLCDGVLEKVKRYPAPSLVITALLGFFLGRLFRR